MTKFLRKFVDSEFRKSLNQGLVGSFLVSLALVLTSLTPVGDSFDNVTKTFEFAIRASTDQAPKVHQSLKILSLDDASVSKLGYHDLSLAEWNYVVHGIAKAKPSAVYIFKTFDYNLNNKYEEKFVERMRQFDFPVYVTGTVTQSALVERGPSLTEGLIPLASLHADDERIDWLYDQKRYLFYGPSPSIASAFSGYGHVQTGKYGTIKPLIHAGDAHAVPHISLIGKPVRIDGEVIRSKNLELRPDYDGDIVVNLVNKREFDNATFSLSDFIEKVRERKPIDYIHAGDTVVILTQMSQGHSEMRDTPLGQLPHNLIHLSMINSTLTNQWLSDFPGDIIFILVAGLLGTLLGALVKKSLVIPLTVLMILTFGFSSLVSFLFFNVAVSWLLPSICLTICSITMLIKQAFQSDRDTRLVRHGLEGRMSPDRIAAFLANRQQAKLEATEHILTIMFIDIVGFSRSSKRKEPGKAFEHLKKLVSEIREIVHEYGGDVDRTMGDALLCVFGYNVADGPTNTSHADQALKCAEAIQRANVRRIITRQNESVVFPLRIGINTANVYIGNLGDSKRIDLTVIGAGVNFAQRLESACDRNMVMVGPSTHDLLRHFPDKAKRLTKRFIRVKHEDELNEAFEYNPFVQDPDILRQCEEIYRDFIGAKRRQNRYLIPPGAGLQASTQLGVGLVIDVSRDGLALQLPVYLSVGVPLSLTLKSHDTDIEQRLATLGLTPITAEVRWATNANKQFLHGVAFKNLSLDQRDSILDLIKQNLGTLELAS